MKWVELSRREMERGREERRNSESERARGIEMDGSTELREREGKRPIVRQTKSERERDG